jgi:hypothetical protein
MKTRLFATVTFLLIYVASRACDVCKKQQPKILRGVTHGTGPQSNWDYIIIAIAVLVVLISLVYSMKYLLRPGERHKEHIKYIILNTPV